MKTISSKFSKVLNQNISLCEDGSINCEDGTEYNPDEIKLLQGISDNLKKSLHLIKKNFNGEVVEYVE